MSRFDDTFKKLLEGTLEERRAAAHELSTVFGPPSSLPVKARPALDDADEEVRLLTARAILRLATQALEIKQIAQVLAPAVDGKHKEAIELYIDLARHCSDVPKALTNSLPALLKASVHCNQLVRNTALAALASAAEHGLDISERFELLWSLLRDMTVVACLAARALKSAHRSGADIFSNDFCGEEITELAQVKTADVLHGLPKDCSNKTQRAKLPLAEEEKSRLSRVEEAERCLACHSTKTRCIFHESYGTNAGKGVLSEYECLACGKFSSFQWDD